MRKISLFILLYFFSCATHGGVYQWTDEDGHIHFGSIPPTPQDEYSLGDALKPAAKKKVTQPLSSPLPPSKTLVPVEKSVHVEEMEEHTVPMPPATPVHKTTAEPVREKELQTLILRLRQDAGEVAEPDMKDSVSLQKQTEENPVPSQTKNIEVVKPVVRSASETETVDSGKSVEQKVFLKVEEVKPIPVEVPQQVSDQPQKELGIESRPVSKHMKETVIEKSLAVEMSQDVPDQKIEAAKDESLPDQKEPVEVKLENISRVGNAQSEAASEADSEADSEAEAELDQEVLEGESPPAQEDVPGGERDMDKCGLFMGFVEQYEVKKSEGCPGPHCDVYKRQLKKFKQKQKRYC